MATEEAEKKKKFKGFALSESHKQVYKVFMELGLYPPLPLDDPRARSNFATISYYRKLTIASWIFKSPMKRGAIMARALTNGCSYDFAHRCLVNLYKAGLVKCSGAVHSRVGAEEDLFTWIKTEESKTEQ